MPPVKDRVVEAAQDVTAKATGSKKPKQTRTRLTPEQRIAKAQGELAKAQEAAQATEAKRMTARQQVDVKRDELQALLSSVENDSSQTVPTRKAFNDYMSVVKDLHKVG